MNDDLSFKKKFITFVGLSFSTILLLLFVIVSFLLNKSFNEQQTREFDGNLKLYGSRIDDKLNSISSVLLDHAGKSVIINPLMQFDTGNLPLKDYLSDLQIIGHKGTFTIITFDHQYLIGKAKFNKSIINQLLENNNKTIINILDEVKGLFEFIVPITYGGVAEGALIFQTSFSVQELFTDLEEEINIILSKNEKGIKFLQNDQEHLTRKEISIGNGFRMELYHDNYIFLKSNFLKIFLIFLTLTIIVFILALIFYYKGKDNFVNPHEKLLEVKKQLNESLDFKNSLINSTKHIIVSTDLDGTILSFNKAAEINLGYNKEEVVGVQSPKIFHDLSEIVKRTDELNKKYNTKLYPGFDVFTYELNQTKAPIEKNWVYIRKDKSQFIGKLIVSFVKSLGETVGYLGIVEDVSEIYAAKEIEKQALREIEEAARLKSEFLANMSHEIRTPMNGILGMVNLLNETTVTNEQKDMLNVVSSCGDGLMNVLNDVLDFSKIDSGKMSLVPVNFDIRENMNDIIHLSSYSAKQKNIELSIEISENTPKYLFGDIMRIKQILINFLSNAVKFTYEGSIILSVEIVEKENIIVKFSVKDSGIGISKGNQAQLFKAFSQADTSITRKYGGTGLGLAISSQLAKLMGGEINLISEKGGGSEFSIAIPLEKGQSPEGISEDFKIKEMVANNIDNRRKNVLVVEDNLVNQKLIVLMLKKIGVTCDIANNGREGIQALKAKKYDIVFMDMQMPVMDGITATENIVILFGDKKPKIVAMTANAFQEDKDKCFAAGMDHFLSKPVNMNELKQVMAMYNIKN